MNAASNRAENLAPAGPDVTHDSAPPTFSSFGPREQARRSWGTAMLSSSVIYVLVAVAVITLGTATKKVILDKKVDVTFVEKIVKEQPPPPPVEVKPPPAPAAAAPVVRPDQKIRKLDKPPPPKELLAPK